jgi:hypothetical protein
MREVSYVQIDVAGIFLVLTVSGNSTSRASELEARPRDQSCLPSILGSTKRRLVNQYLQAFLAAGIVAFISCDTSSGASESDRYKTSVICLTTV